MSPNRDRRTESGDRHARREVEAVTGAQAKESGRMKELAACIAGLAATVSLGVILVALTEGTKQPPRILGIALFLDRLVMLYFLVRFVHWS